MSLVSASAVLVLIIVILVYIHFGPRTVRTQYISAPSGWRTLYLHGVCMLRECIYGECAHEQHVRRTLTLTTNSHDHCLLSNWICRMCVHTHLRPLGNEIWVMLDNPVPNDVVRVINNDSCSGNRRNV